MARIVTGPFLYPKPGKFTSKDFTDLPKKDERMPACQYLR